MASFKIDKAHLLDGVRRAAGVANPKGPMAVLGCVLIDVTSDGHAHFAASDLDQFISGRYTAAKVAAPGRICLPAKELLAIVSNLPGGEVSIEKDGRSSVKITSGAVSYDLRDFPADVFPDIPSAADVEMVVVDKTQMLNMINSTLFSVAQDDPRLFLNGVNFERIDNGSMRMVSTDGHRLSLCDGDFPHGSPIGSADDPAVILPERGLVELKKIMEAGAATVKIGVSGSRVYASADNVEFSTRTIEGSFPDYNLVIPKESKHVIKIGRDALSAAVKRVALLASDKGSPLVKFEFADGSLTVASANPDRGTARESLAIDFSGETIAIGFNAKYIMEALAQIDTDEVTVRLLDGLAPAVIQDVNGGPAKFIIMPMRV